MDSSPIIEGSFDDFSFDDLVSVLGVSRQPMAVTTFRPDGTTPTFAVMSGRLLNCSVSGSRLRGVEAFKSIVQNPGRRFVVHRTARPLADRSIGTLGELVREASRPRSGQGRAVAQGRFSEHPLRSVLAVLATSRQSLTLHFLDIGSPHARVWLKSGLVLAAEREGESGLAAWARLLRSPGERFLVTRNPPGRMPAHPLGPISELVEPVPTPTRAVVVLEGEFSQFPIASVLKVVGVSRSCLDLRTRRGDREDARLLVKAGQVLEVRYPGAADPVVALRRLLDDPGDGFVVLRRPTPPHAVPLGSLEILTSEVHGLDDEVTVLGPSMSVPSRDSARSLPSPTLAPASTWSERRARSTPPPAPPSRPPPSSPPERVESRPPTAHVEPAPAPADPGTVVPDAMPRAEAPALEMRLERLLEQLVDQTQAMQELGQRHRALQRQVTVLIAVQAAALIALGAVLAVVR